MTDNKRRELAQFIAGMTEAEAQAVLRDWGKRINGKSDKGGKGREGVRIAGPEDGGALRPPDRRSFR